MRFSNVKGPSYLRKLSLQTSHFLPRFSLEVTQFCRHFWCVRLIWSSHLQALMRGLLSKFSSLKHNLQTLSVDSITSVDKQSTEPPIKSPSMSIPSLPQASSTTTMSSNFPGPGAWTGCYSKRSSRGFLFTSLAGLTLLLDAIICSKKLSWATI